MLSVCCEYEMNVQRKRSDNIFIKLFTNTK
jgi:hypothetical protein